MRKIEKMAITVGNGHLQKPFAEDEEDEDEDDDEFMRQYREKRLAELQQIQRYLFSLYYYIYNDYYYYLMIIRD